MCRLLAYIGAPINVDQLIYQPKNSLVHQSYEAKELEEPLNGDGFGLGWYVPEIDAVPAVFVSTSPAWSNRNLRMIAPKIMSPCIFAHVRAASVGDTSESNCHPFSYKNFMCMHNGTIGGFPQLKRTIRRGFTDEVYNSIRGQTDSEHFFAMFLDKVVRRTEPTSGQNIRDTLVETIRDIEALRRQIGTQETCYLNVALTDGETVVAARYISDPNEEPLSLYYSEGSRYICEEGVCRMEKADPDNHAVLIVSEKLTDLRSDWTPVPRNAVVMIDKNASVSVVPIVL